MSENELKLPSGWPMLVVVILAPFIGALVLLLTAMSQSPAVYFVAGVGCVLGFVAWVISLFGFVVVNPNQARVIQLFGTYVGTVKETGFFYANPFYNLETSSNNSGWTVYVGIILLVPGAK